MCIGCNPGPVGSKKAEDAAIRSQREEAEAEFLKTAVSREEMKRLCAIEWENGAKAQCEMSDGGKMGWFHLERDAVTGVTRLYKPVWTFDSRPIDQDALNAMETIDKPALPTKGKK